jgi:hypothetical protein
MRFSHTTSIECGEHTCCNVSGKACEFLAIRHSGSDAVCILSNFSTAINGRINVLRTKAGWVLRSQECLETFKKSEQTSNDEYRKVDHII